VVQNLLISQCPCGFQIHFSGLSKPLNLHRKKRTMSLSIILGNISSFIFFILWIGMPFWLFARRSKGWISIKRTHLHGERKECGLELEVAIFIFVIPSLALFFFTLIYVLIISFIPPASRSKVSIELTSLIMDILIIIYIYLIERSIFRKKLDNNYPERYNITQ